MSFDFVPGEEVIARIPLRKEAWKRFRCVQCSTACAASVWGSILIPFYAILGVPCRQSEADSFELVLTNQNIHFRQKLYQCGICCQNSKTIVIPLKRIQDIELVSDCCGDCCGFVDTPGQPYKLFVQTAAMGGMMPELVVICIEDPREFKRQVMTARNAVRTDTNIAGQSKTVEVTQSTSPDVQRVLALLERQVEENARLTAMLTKNQTRMDSPSI